jgi:4,5-DOPA dioxygenase extradiol
MALLPTVFVSHGMPAIVVRPGPTHDFLKQLGQTFRRPTAIICISAHMEASWPILTAAEEPETIHDFGGPKVLFQKQYPAPGQPDLAREAAALLNQAGFKAQTIVTRGLDHGAWVPLMLMYPEADIPTIQLSVQTELDPRHHLDLGRALQPLREEGILILGSGGATHNLPEIGNFTIDSQPPDYATAFDYWLETAITTGQEASLLNYQTQAPSASRNHPYPAEHFLPLFVPLGAAGIGARGRVLHKAFMYGVLSMAAYAWD